jgi:hypothetical protein
MYASRLKGNQRKGQDVNVVTRGERVPRESCDRGNVTRGKVARSGQGQSSDSGVLRELQPSVTYGLWRNRHARQIWSDRLEVVPYHQPGVLHDDATGLRLSASCHAPCCAGTVPRRRHSFRTQIVGRIRMKSVNAETVLRQIHRGLFQACGADLTLMVQHMRRTNQSMERSPADSRLSWIVLDLSYD